MVKNLYTIIFLSFFFFNNSLFAQSDEIQFTETRDVGTGVFLKWTMPDSENFEQFFLEKATTNGKFETIESYTHADEDEKNNFSFFDNALGVKKMKYRIRCVSSDKGTFFSEVLPFEKKVKTIYRIASKELISEGYFKITIESIAIGDVEFSLRDEFGEKILKKDWGLTAGLNEFFIDLDEIPDGNYSGLIQGGRQTNAINFTKKSRSNSGVALKKN